MNLLPNASGGKRLPDQNELFRTIALLIAAFGTKDSRGQPQVRLSREFMEDFATSARRKGVVIDSRREPGTRDVILTLEFEDRQAPLVGGVED